MVAHFPIDISIKSSSNRKIWVIGRNWSGYITHTAFKLTACLVFVGVCARKSCRSYHAECQYHTRITTTPFSCDIEMKISNKIRSQSVFGHCIFTQPSVVVVGYTFLLYFWKHILYYHWLVVCGNGFLMAAPCIRISTYWQVESTLQRYITNICSFLRDKENEKKMCSLFLAWQYVSKMRNNFALNIFSKKNNAKLIEELRFKYEKIFSFTCVRADKPLVPL